MPRILNKSYETLNVIISTGRARELLGKNLTVEKLAEMSDEEVEAYYKIYELNYADKVSNYLIDAVYHVYSYIANKYLPIDDIEKLRENLHSDYILTTELKTITSCLATTCGKFMAIASLDITTSKHIRRAPEKKQMKCRKLTKNNE